MINHRLHTQKKEALLEQERQREKERQEFYVVAAEQELRKAANLQDPDQAPLPPSAGLREVDPMGDTSFQSAEAADEGSDEDLARKLSSDEEIAAQYRYEQLAARREQERAN